MDPKLTRADGTSHRVVHAMERPDRESPAADCDPRRTALVDDNLPPRALWPDLVYEPAGLRYPVTVNLADELIHGSGAAPDKTAIFFRDEQVSYGELRRRTLAIAGELLRVAVEPADRVALMMPNGPDLVATWLAIQWVGAIGVPIPPTYRRREIEHILDDARACVLVCSPELSTHIEAVGSRLRVRVVAVRASDDHEEMTAGAYATRCDDPVLITYITNPNGRPKGVVHSAADLLAGADTYAREILQLTAADVCIGTMSVASAFGLGALLTFPLRVGAAAVLLDFASTLPTAITASRATILFGPPTLYRMLLRQPDFDSFDLRSLRCCVSAAEPLPPNVAVQWRERTGFEILDGLGTTELAHIVISARPGAVRPGTIGTPVRGYQARIVDGLFRNVPDGIPGQLAVRGPTGARYWRDPEAQRRAVRCGWTLTGDVCVRQEGGYIQHISRTDDLIVSAGSKISIREVEQALEEHPDVSRAQVFAAADSVRGAVAHAIVNAAPGANVVGLGERLQQYLKNELAPYKCPREIQVSQAPVPPGFG